MKVMRESKGAKACASKEELSLHVAIENAIYLNIVPVCHLSACDCYVLKIMLVDSLTLGHHQVV